MMLRKRFCFRTIGLLACSFLLWSCSSNQQQQEELQSQQEGEAEVGENQQEELGEEGNDLLNENNEENEFSNELGGDLLNNEELNQNLGANLNEASAPAFSGNEQVDTGAGVESSEFGVGGLIGGMSGVGVGSGLPEMGSKMAYTVQAGDTLGKISKRIYGNHGMWTKLAKWSSITNPHLIHSGDVVYYQLDSRSVEFAKSYDNLPKREYTVATQQSLQNVAQNLYGKSGNWRELWRNNGHVTNPQKIEIGTTIVYVSQSDYAGLNKSLDGISSINNKPLMKSTVAEKKVDVPSGERMQPVKKALKVLKPIWQV